MTDEQWQDRTDDNLVEEAQTGLRGQGAVVEMMRRLKNSLVEQQKSTNRLTWGIALLTVALLILALIEIVGR